MGYYRPIRVTLASYTLISYVATYVILTNIVNERKESDKVNYRVDIPQESVAITIIVCWNNIGYFVNYAYSSMMCIKLL